MLRSLRPAVLLLWVSLAAVVIGAVYIGVVLVQRSQSGSEESVGARPEFSASASAGASSAPTSAPTGSALPTPSASGPGPILVSSPKRLRIPAMDVDTKVFPVALDENRAVEIPQDIRYVGWYELGVPPGVDRGSAVIVGHRDGVKQGRGVFYDLGSLKPGDKVFVMTSEGQELPYKVVSREYIRKKSLPYAELFAVDGDPRLTLISCGGYYDRNNGGYQDNIVVTALPQFEPVKVEPVSG